MSEKKSFKETKFYPIFFMVLITVFFVGILATFYHLTKPRVENYREQNLQKAILDLFEYPILNSLNETYNNYITEKKLEDIIYYQANSEDRLLGYVFQISGSGLWGTITMLVAVNPDFTKIISLGILDQNETPGLGGRITEDWFKIQFNNKPLNKKATLIQADMVAEGEIPEMQVIQITGATFSSKAVVDIIYNELNKIALSFGESNE
ncbi:MAG: FMN-binding protein [Candidatus Cloacimonetes bacterium]|nr:FMN-binding protein [Candidatus Cloacimonadota bacterium]